MNRKRRPLSSQVLLAGLLGLVSAILTSGPTPALASCVRALPTAEALAVAPVAFVGTVQSVSAQGRVAEVLVESVWAGADIPSHVTVDGRLSTTAVTSVDRTFEVGARLLFIPQGEASPFRDNSCSATTAFTEGLAALKPGAAHAPTAIGAFTLAPVGTSPADRPWLPVAVLLVGLALGAALVGVVLRSRRAR